MHIFKYSISCIILELLGFISTTKFWGVIILEVTAGFSWVLYVRELLIK